MKILLTYIILLSGFMATAQVPNVHPRPAKAKDNYPQNSRKHTSPVKTSSRPVNPGRTINPSSPAVSPTPNDRGTTVNSSNAINTDINRNKTPFVSGIHAAPNAARPFDSLNNKKTLNDPTVGTIVPGVNDTTFNINTISPEGVNTISGAVDRSGQSQFGQTNWGRSVRNTVGESQWTIPPPITATFTRENPAGSNAEWRRNQADSSLYDVRYQSGALWVTATYNADGTRVNTRTEMPLVQAPAPVLVFMAKQPKDLKLVAVSRLIIQGKPEVYELILANGQTTYVDTNGMEVKL